MIDQIQDPHHRELFQNYLNKNIKFTVTNPPEKNLFEMESELIIPVPLDFIQKEVVHYDLFFMNHIKAFLPTPVLSTDYNEDNHILTVTVKMPDMDLSLRVKYNISFENQTYKFKLITEGATGTAFRDSLISIHVESLPEDSQYTIARFHSITHYEVDDNNSEEIYDTKKSLQVFELEKKLNAEMITLCLEIAQKLSQKYKATESNSLFELLLYLGNECDHYSTWQTRSDEEIKNKRDTLMTRLFEARNEIIALGNTPHIVKRFNELIIRIKDYKAYSSEGMGSSLIERWGYGVVDPGLLSGEYFELLDHPKIGNKKIYEIMIDDNSALFELARADKLDPWSVAYAKRITQDYQTSIFKKLIAQNFRNLNFYAEASTISNEHAAKVFEFILDYPRSQNCEPSYDSLQYVLRITNEYQKEAFLFASEGPHYTYRTVYDVRIREALYIHNSFSLRAFKAIFIQNNSITMTYATRVITEEQALQFEKLVEKNIGDPEAYRKIVEDN
ncbi:MAG: hypothetical protein HYW47_02595 [Deltaproteobacteria bacterium]|nr:hypothetical protein [Deltaproteobacteria bacterium]